ncbi:MAG TPA: PP2C family protein-serine/threonine phosphatase [Thermoanaerobaculia bacterium]|nr:PP2C family protein-serine/threonine phosphatase [Thermoanaerobaculia bacterium]
MQRSGVPPEVLNALREDIVPAAIGFVICGIALAALALALVRRRSRNLALIDMACLAGLYGVRLLADTSAAELLFGLTPAFLERFTNVATYLVAIPATLFFENMLGSGWKSSVRWLRWAFIALAVVAVPAEIFLPEPGTLLPPYRFLVIVSVLVMVAHLFWPGRFRNQHLQWLRASLAVLALFVVNENLQDLGWTPWEADLEPVGFLLFLGGLGIAAARGLLESQERLASLRQELETARQIQASTLPQKTPDIAGLDLAARYLPAESVAGDFYDFLPGEGRRLGIFLADVSGHGVPAALVASMLKVAVASQAGHAESPALVLTGVNQVLHGKLPGNRFITAVYVFLDLESSRIIYGRAGHPPPLLWRRSEGRVEELRHGGLVMGRLARSSYTEASVPVAPGDRLLLFTDGIPEAGNRADEQFGDDRLQQFLASQGDRSADGVAAALLERVRGWRGREDFEDDLTLVAVGVG